jgi:ribosomal protein S18 acetylase RimI-like enzyme
MPISIAHTTCNQAPITRRLAPSDAPAFQALRLSALRGSPCAFGSSYEEEYQTPPATIEAQLAPDSGRNVFGAFAGPELVGMVGVGRESARKLKHKGFIRGMCVMPAHRSKGLGKQLLRHALAFASSLDGLRQVSLTVTAGNIAAIAMYEAEGFSVFGREPGALLVDGVLYEYMHMVRNVETGKLSVR